MNDFASEEYVTKNIRVMPMGGGLSIDNTSEHTSKYYMSGMGQNADDNADAEDTKHNQEAYMHMMDERHKIKEMKAEADRKAHEAAEREAKLK